MCTRSAHKRKIFEMNEVLMRPMGMPATQTVITEKDITIRWPLASISITHSQHLALNE